MQELNYHNLLMKLNSLCEFLDKTYDVNLGGCCFLAYLIAKHLDKLNIKYDLIIYDDFAKDKVCIEHEVINCHKNRSPHNSVTGRYSCNHYCLQLRKVGLINGDYESTHQYSIPDVSYKNIQWIYKNGSWNDCYKIQYNKIIKNIVKEFFKEYE